MTPEIDITRRGRGPGKAVTLSLQGILVTQNGTGLLFTGETSGGRGAGLPGQSGHRGGGLLRTAGKPARVGLPQAPQFFLQALDPLPQTADDSCPRFCLPPALDRFRAARAGGGTLLPSAVAAQIRRTGGEPGFLQANRPLQVRLGLGGTARSPVGEPQVAMRDGIVLAQPQRLFKIPDRAGMVAFLVSDDPQREPRPVVPGSRAQTSWKAAVASCASPSSQALRPSAARCSAASSVAGGSASRAPTGSPSSSRRRARSRGIRASPGNALASAAYSDSASARRRALASARARLKRMSTSPPERFSALRSGARLRRAGPSALEPARGCSAPHDRRRGAPRTGGIRRPRRRVLPAGRRPSPGATWPA